MDFYAKIELNIIHIYQLNCFWNYLKKKYMRVKFKLGLNVKSFRKMGWQTFNIFIWFFFVYFAWFYASLRLLLLSSRTEISIFGLPLFMRFKSFFFFKDISVLYINLIRRNKYLLCVGKCTYIFYRHDSLCCCCNSKQKIRWKLNIELYVSLVCQRKM